MIETDTASQRPDVESRDDVSNKFRKLLWEKFLPFEKPRHKPNTLYSLEKHDTQQNA